MEDQDTDQHTAAVKAAETHSTKLDLSAHDEDKQENTGLAPNEKQQHPEDSGSAEGKKAPLTEKNSTPPQADESHGDCNRETARKEAVRDNESDLNEDLAPESSTTQKNTERTVPEGPGNLEGGNHRGEEEETETESRMQEEPALPQDTSVKKKRDEPGKKVETICSASQETPVATDPVGPGSFGGGNHSGEEEETETESRMQEEPALPQDTSVKKKRDEPGKKVETICSASQETPVATDPVGPGSFGGNGILLIMGIVVVVVVAILFQHFLKPESPPQKDEVRQIDIFLKQLEKVKTRFPNQRPELWNRSKIHLMRHLQTAQPTEPVSLILTAGGRAEKTLRCLAQGLASAFSSALNASVLHIDGASKASQDSDQVKLDIDSKLQGAFEGDKPMAVIHRFEELPPGSTLIFYRYCDHENAAYKKTGLIFTVLLGEVEEIPANSHLSTVEEMVDDHLQKKFLSDDYPVSFDRMDLDKYGGLWSRISHLILPVAAEERMEHEGC